MKMILRLAVVVFGIVLAGCGGGHDSASSDTFQNNTDTRVLSHTIGVGDNYNDVVQQLYVAYFGRPADITGLTNFKTQLASASGPDDIHSMDAAYQSNLGVRALIDSFGTSAESNSLYGSGDTTSFVSAIYRNVLNRTPDGSGLQFWVNAINSGVLTRARASFSIMAGALKNTTPQGLADAALVNKKIAVATSFTHSLPNASVYNGDIPAANARNLLAKVTDATDVDAFQQSILDTINTLNTPPASGAAAAFFEALRAAPLDMKIVRELGADKVVEARDKQTGEVIEIFGSKDAGGAIVDVQKVTRTETSGAVTTTEYGADGKRTIASDNVRMELSQQPDGRWLAEFSDMESGTVFKTTMPEQGGPGNQSSVPAVAVDAQAASTANKILATINTSNCGTPGDPTGQRVFVNFNDNLGKLISTHLASRISAGVYRAEVPNPDAKAPLSMDYIKSSLENLNTAMDAACQADSASPLSAPQACLYVSTAMASTGIGAAVAPKFLAICEAGVVSMKAGCKVKGSINVPAPDAVSDSGAEVLKSIESVMISLIPDSIAAPQLVPFIEALPAPIYGTPGTVQNPSDELQLSLDIQAMSVGDVILNPSAPAAGMQYTASAELRCVPTGSNAQMSISGTDGYTDMTSLAFNDGVSSRQISLLVPGAESGIRDVVSLTVNAGNGSQVQKSAFLVFQ